MCDVWLPECKDACMNISSLSSIIPQYPVGELSSAASSLKTAATGGGAQESSGLSELGTLMKALQNLEKTDPAKFKEVTAEVTKKLEDAAKTAADSGDTQGAEALNGLAAKFKTASETGKAPHLHRGAPPASKHQDLLTMFQNGSGTDPFSTLTDILNSEIGSAATSL
jgi:hypothetical protein